MGEPRHTRDTAIRWRDHARLSSGPPVRGAALERATLDGWNGDTIITFDGGTLHAIDVKTTNDAVIGPDLRWFD